MALQGLRSGTGLLVTASDGEQVLFDGTETVTPSEAHPAIDAPANCEPPRRGPLVLGPIDGPPLPMSIVSRGAFQKRFVHAPFPLRLDLAISDGYFNGATRALLHDYMSQLPPDAPIAIDAALPLGYGVDLDLLSRHVAAMGATLGRRLSMTLTLPQAGD